MVERSVPILPSRDLSASLRFYEALGFTNVGAPPDQWDYLILARGAIMVHLIADPTVDPLRTASSCYVYVDDADALYLRWQASWPQLSRDELDAGARLVAPTDTPYGMREMAVVDPDGNLVRVGSSLPTQDSPDGQDALT
jgi:predicted lactoylglutathione lyase